MAESLKFTNVSMKKSTQIQSDTVIPLVLLHGWGLNSGVWQPLIAQLSSQLTNQFQIITIDLPGFGQNNQLTVEPYSLENICHHIDKIIQQPAIYLGWSLGGLVATQIALSYPEKVLGLITVASSPLFVEQSEIDSKVASWPGIKPCVLGGFHQQLSKDTAKTIKEFLKIQAMGSPHIRQDVKQITNLVMELPLPNKSALNDSLALLASTDFRQQLTSILSPFLRLYGGNDSLVPKSITDTVALLAPNSNQHIFPHASHAPFISHLNDFSKVLSSWLIENYRLKSKAIN